MPVARFWSSSSDLGQIWRGLGLLCLTLMLWRLEIGVRMTSTRVSFNKAMVCGAPDPSDYLFTGRYGGEWWSWSEDAGDSGKEWLAAWWSSCGTARLCCCDFGPVRRPLHINLGSDSSTACMSSTLMAERRLLPHCTPASGARDLIYFCRRMVLFINLLALVPLWRPFNSDVVCSRCSTPSGHVPGGVAVDHSRMLWQGFGGEGARRSPGLDCFLQFCSRVFSAKVRGHVVFSFISEVLHVICTPLTMT
jgi:hypothetical protein